MRFKVKVVKKGGEGIVEESAGSIAIPKTNVTYHASEIKANVHAENLLPTVEVGDRIVVTETFERVISEVTKLG